MDPEAIVVNVVIAFVAVVVVIGATQRSMSAAKCMYLKIFKAYIDIHIYIYFLICIYVYVCVCICICMSSTDTRHNATKI